MHDSYRNKWIFFLKGVRDSFPIVIGYFPIALTFGLSSIEAGFSSNFSLFISMIMFAGASQFAFLGMIEEGATLPFTVLICLALNIRHIIYGPTLSVKLKEKKLLPLLSFGLTDEVFGLAFANIESHPKEVQSMWLLGIEVGAYLSWTIATYIGACSHEIVDNYFPSIFKESLSFSLPALFLAILIPMIDRETAWIILLSFIVTFIFIAFGLASYSPLCVGILNPILYMLFRGKWWNQNL